MVIYNPEGTAVISVKVDDSSYVYEEIMGDDNVVLEFSLTDHIELEPGSFVLFRGKKYELLNRTDVTIQHTRDYQYKATFSGPQARFSRYVVYNSIDGRVRFDMIGTPLDHLNLVLGNLLLREPGLWSLGSYVVDKPQTLVSYNHTSIKDALNAIAEAFDTEWSVTQEGNGYVINLRKNEFNKDAPLALAYGKNRGFKPGVGRVNYGEFGQVQKAWIDGGERNLSIGEYGWTTLHFPAGLSFLADKNGKLSITVDGTTYSDDGFDGASALEFVTDEWGASVRLADAPTSCNEVSLDLTQFYPKRVGSVTGVQYLYKGQYLTYEELIAAYPNLTKEDWLEIQVDIIDTTIPEDLDYAACCISPDDPMTVIFQDGQLIGREFSAAFYKEAKTRVVDGETVTIRPANRFELVRTSIDGEDMPNAVFRPNTTGTDKYIVVNIYMPEQYICNIKGLEGAEIEALREACKFIQENKDPQFTFKGVVDELYVKRNEGAIGGKLKVGGCISFQDSNIQPEPIVTRIIGIKTYVNNENAPELTLSNETVKGGMSSTLAKLRASDEHVMERVKEGRRFTQRSFRDAKETISMLAGALDYFTEGIHPITVETMSLLVGDQSLQFKFWTDRTCTEALVNPVVYDPDTHKVNIPACVIQHMTLDIADVAPSASRTADEYLRWSMQQYESEALTGVDEQGNDKSATAYYVYARVDAANVAKPDDQRTAEELSHIGGTFLLSKTKRPFKPTEQDNFYHLLVGILNSEYEGGRSFAPMYGFTEVLPGQITTDVIRSASGDSYFDLANNQFALGNSLQFINNALTLRGAMVVNGAGERTSIGAWCGQWNVPAGRQYAKGDEVWWEAPDGSISTYRYINDNPSQASSSNDPSHGNYWEVTARGVAGDSGASALAVDMTNEADGVAVGSDGVLNVDVELETTVNAYYGTEDTNITGIRASIPSEFAGDIDVRCGSSSIISSSYQTASANSLDIRILIDEDTDFNGVVNVPITIYVRCGSLGDRELVYTLLPIKEGEDGSVFKLMPDYNAVKGSRSGSSISYSPTKVQCTRMLGKGTDFSASEYGVLKYSKNGGSTKLDYPSGGVTSSQAASAGKIIFYWYAEEAMTTLLDQEVVPIVVDGAAGASGNGILNIVDHYVGPIADGNNQPADSAFDAQGTTRPTPVPGMFIWVRTTISFTDSSIPDKKFYEAQYCAEGAQGPAICYRGEYDKNERNEYDLDGNGNVIHQTYYGTETRRDVVYYRYNGQGKFYMSQKVAGETFNSGNNPQPPVLANGQVNTAYWGEFGASFSNVATGLLFAVESVIEKAIVRLLKTANEGNARIVAREDALSMFDGSDNEKLRIHGGSLSETRTSDDYDFYQTWYAISYNETLVGTVDYTETSLLLSSQGFQFDCYEGAVLNIPAVVMDVEMFLNPTPSGSIQGGGFIRFGWKLDGVEISEEDVNVWFGTSIDPVTMPARQISLSEGQHELRLWGRFQGGASPIPSNTELRCYVYTQNSRRISVTYADQITEVASNGFQVRFGSNQMLRCIKTTNDIELMMQADNYGIRLSSSYLHLRINGTWYNCTRDTNGYLKLNLI